MKRKKEIILSTLAIILAITTAILTQPHYTNYQLSNEERQATQARQRDSEAHRQEEARKQKEAQSVQTKPQEAAESSSPQRVSTPTVSLSGSLIQMINSYRNSIGRSTLVEASDMSAKASAEAQYTSGPSCTYDALRHSGYPYETIGCQYGYPDNDAHVVQDWFNSPPHRHILTGAFNYIGCAKVTVNNIDWYACELK